MKLACLKPKNYHDWDNFVDKSYSGTVFHKTPWLKTVQPDFKIMACFDHSNNLIAGLPIFEIKNFGFTTNRTPELTSYNGIVTDSCFKSYHRNISRNKKIFTCFAHELKKIFSSFQLHFYFDNVDLQPFQWENCIGSFRYSYRLTIKSLNDAWHNLAPRKRTDVRKAEKDGIIIEKIYEPKRVTDLVKMTFERQNKKSNFLLAWEKKYSEFSKDCQSFLFIAKNRKGKDIAALSILADKKRIYFQLNGYDHSAKHKGANALLFWSVIKFAHENLQLNEVDFNGSMIPKIENFYRRFNAKLVLIPIISYQTSLYKSLSHIKQKFILKG